MSNIYEGLQRTRETLYAAPTTFSRKDDAKIIKMWERQQKGQKRLGSREIAKAAETMEEPETLWPWIRQHLTTKFKPRGFDLPSRKHSQELVKKLKQQAPNKLSASVRAEVRRNTVLPSAGQDVF
ncbi:small integral membrane protein 5 isoform X1 [Lepidochelys kempii]|uniref:small integral membrane protein 5 isoform X1 n=1 Tax=Lepidochelys kempii TaxID=8472 RepID=UPI003C6FB812